MHPKDSQVKEFAMNKNFLTAVAEGNTLQYLFYQNMKENHFLSS